MREAVASGPRHSEIALRLSKNVTAYWSAGAASNRHFPPGEAGMLALHHRRTSTAWPALARPFSGAGKSSCAPDSSPWGVPLSPAEDPLGCHLAASQTLTARRQALVGRGHGLPSATELTIALIAALMGSGRLGHELTSAARSGSEISFSALRANAGAAPGPSDAGISLPCKSLGDSPIGLENRCAREGTGGSNPLPSANSSCTAVPADV